MTSSSLSSALAGRYRLLARAGAGATSEVWRAEAPDGTALALKIGHDLGVAPILAAEAIALALAPSPRLPELIDVGVIEPAKRRGRVEPARPYLALRWIEGSPPSANSDPLQIAHDAAEALADLHALGLAHGDVKPDNVLVDRHGRAALVDLGLCGPAYETALSGGTPRYLARGDRQLGDARARDLLALGLVLAEIATPELAQQPAPLALARSRAPSGPLGAICAALLAPEPGARPSARWVVERALAGLPAARGGDDALSQRLVRVSYLALRRRELCAGATVAGELAPWIAPVAALIDKIRGVCRAANMDTLLGLDLAAMSAPLAPLDVAGRRRWLAALVGRSAASWPAEAFARASEPELAEALLDLARTTPPAAWTLRELSARLQGRGREATGPTSPHSPISPQPLDLAAAAALGLRVSRIPADERALAAVERLGDEAPLDLVRAAADALRLAGELGRARSLVLAHGAAGPVAADVLRRCGDLEHAATVARAALDAGADRDGRARACLARIALDGGDVAGAETLVAEPATAAEHEVAALVCARRGDRARALALAERGLSLADGAEARARLAATIGYVESGRAPERARRSFAEAVEHAERAGATLEEASYRTGEAAACVDLGELESAIATAERAALLWEQVLGRPGMAARAWLAIAAAHAAVGAALEARRAAEHAWERAAASGDPRAEAYACWAVCDALPAGDAEAVRLAQRAAARLELSPDVAPASLDDDGLEAAARLWRHAALAQALLERCDETAARRDTSASARLAWWGARAERLLDSVEPADRVLAELALVADVVAPVAAIGKAMHAGVRLAARRGELDRARRFETARERAARPVLASTRTILAEAARACEWLGPADRHEVDGEQAIDLERLVRALGERHSLRVLLDRVLDVLLLWTGAERGLLLMTAPEGRLRPRAARNLGREDLRGEQLAVSTSLAQQALASREPVVAIDAMAELGGTHHSVHALKLRSVLALPLVARGEVLGVVYLDDRVRSGAFGKKQLAWAQAVAPVAALAIADARDQVRLRRSVHRAELASRRLEEALARKETELDVAARELERSGRRLRFAEIIGESPAIQRLLTLVERVAASDVPVLLRGESGSGKELVARALHAASPRAAQPFVSENCGALPETLLESALFGHVRGAFTGALRPRVGLFEAADGGTLFLDEIGEMSLGMQTKLLRVLEDGQVRPVGSERSRHVDVRVLAATHRDLEQMVAERRFREDLYYRLDVVAVPIPPLRERPADIPLLVRHFLDKHAPAGTRPTVADTALDALTRFPWPGNVRQLENEIRRALLLCDGAIRREHLSIVTAAAPAAGPGLEVRARVDQLETELVREALAQTNRNQTQAAKLLGVSRFGLSKMMKRLGID